MLLSEQTLEYISLDLPALLTAIFCGLSCAILGNFLVLRRLSLMGDSISHAVLPGIVLGFLLTSSRSNLVVFVGAALAGVLCAVLVQLVKQLGRVEASAAMGVVFSIFFASGVLLMEQAAARSVDLDADCLLYGQLETIFWYAPKDLESLLSLHSLGLLPAQLISSFIVLALCLAFVTIFYKELTISSFDPELSSALGFNSKILHYALMVLVAAAVVASFEAVGSILVISSLVCPAATARLFTDRLRTQIALSALFIVGANLLGYYLGAFAPQHLGYAFSLNIAGAISVASALFLGAAILFAPRYGVLASRLRLLNVRIKIVGEDILGFLYRFEELNRVRQGKLIKLDDLRKVLGKTWHVGLALKSLLWQKLVFKQKDSSLSLSASGEVRAQKLVRTHRLWESYLFEKLALPLDHLHQRAEQIEHFTGDVLRESLAQSQKAVKLDPHGRPIPE